MSESHLFLCQKPSNQVCVCEREERKEDVESLSGAVVGARPHAHAPPTITPIDDEHHGR